MNFLAFLIKYKVTQTKDGKLRVYIAHECYEKCNINTYMGMDYAIFKCLMVCEYVIIGLMSCIVK